MTTTRKNQAGQALVFAVVALGVLLIGFAGLGIDIGYLRYEKRRQQGAADSAAVAGASNLLFGGVTTGAQNASITNGFTDASSNTLSTCTGNDSHSATLLGKVCVQVSNPPTSGPHSGSASSDCSPSPSCYVEVYVSEVQPTFFMRVLGIKSEVVTARAVAVLAGSGSGGCIYTLDRGGTGITIKGTPNVLTANNCGIVDNSNLDVTGNGHPSISAGSIGAVSGSACNSPQCSPSAVIGIAPSGDPLAYLTPPSTSGTCTPDPNVTISTTLNPGHFCSLTIATAKKSPAPNVTFNPGVYVIDHDFNASTAGTLSGNNVMFYDVNGSLDLSGGNQMNFTASNTTNSATGQAAGILFWEPVSNTNGLKLHGNSTTVIQGGIYMPGATVTMDGNNSLALYTLIIVNMLRLNGNNSLTINGNTSGITGGSPIKNAVLVE